MSPAYAARHVSIRTVAIARASSFVASRTVTVMASTLPVAAAAVARQSESGSAANK